MSRSVRSRVKSSQSCQCSRRDLLAGAVAGAAAILCSRLTLAQAVATSATQPAAGAVAFAARPLPLSAVRLTGGPLKHAQELTMQNQLKLEPDRMMFHMRDLAGLKPKADQGYGSWDGPGRNLTGHIAGHCLSGLSYMYAATGDERFKHRADYLVDEMGEVQEKRGNGYIGALMGGGGRGGAAPVDGLSLFEEVSRGQIRGSAFDLNGMWSPWYVQHKIFAGLRDAYRRTGNAKALRLSVKFAAWVESIVAPLNDEQFQRMLSTEFGGINESFADLYVDTGEKRWLDLSAKFLHKAVVAPLAAHHDILGGKHGNTQVPKLLGELARHICAGDATSGEAAKYFWEAVVYHHSFATGGHGYDEYFDAADKLSDEIDGKNHRTPDHRTCESCNVYNMLKFTRLLFALQPDEKFAAFQERAMFNHALASINFNDGQVCYMVPVGQGVTHEYQGNGFTCCVGTGLENHALHGDGIFYESADHLWINLFAPSTARSAALGLSLAMETTFPEGEDGSVKLTLDSPKGFAINMRRPSWAGEGYTLAVNGKSVENLSAPGSYIELKRNWTTGDTITFTLPKRLRSEPLPDNAGRMALMWGPLVLGADLGAATRGRRTTTAPAFPQFVALENVPVEDWLKPVDGKPGSFHAAAAGSAEDVTFRPFYQLSDRRYGIYCDVVTPAQLAAPGADKAAKQTQ